MDLKTILVPLGAEPPEAATLAALSLARRFGGVVRAVYARGEPVAAGQFRYPALGDGVIAQVEDLSREVGMARHTRAREAFEALIARAGGDVAVRWEEVDADGPDAIAHQGAIFDLLVLGAGERDDPDMVEAALFRTGRPVLFVPDGFAGPVGGRIHVGWNRTAESGHAVVAALPLMRAAESVTVCAVHTAAKQGPPPEAVVAYLAAHGIDAGTVTLDPAGRPIGSVLLDHAQGAGADLVVAGANFRGRLRRTRPGGVTEYLLRESTLPLLMAH